MKGKKYFVSLWAVVVLLVSCNESLEDTYGKYAGDGKIRYIGKCYDLSVTPGWERLNIEWSNSVDEVIDKIKVSWTESGVKRDSLLERTATSCDIRNLKEGTYRIDICAVSKDGDESLMLTNYGRPYTEEHEAIRSFTQAITKFYRVNDHLLFFMDKWNDRLVEINLNYTGTDGEEKVYPLTKEVFQKEFIDLAGVDTRKPMTVTRLGKLDGCADIIRFAPVILGKDLLLTSDFKLAVQQRYGFSDQTEEQKKKLEHFIDTVRVLEFDYDMGSFEDVLYCSKLEKLVLGKNRYLDLVNRIPADISVLYDETRSLTVLDAANRLTGLKIERYNEHYFTQSRAYIQEMGNPVFPTNLTYIQQSVVDEITSSIKDIVGYDSGLKNLLDNDPATWWEPFESNTIRTFELTITLKFPQMVRGFKIVQKVFDPAADPKSSYYLPRDIRLQVSADNIRWTNVTHVNENPIGCGVGERTLLPMAVPREIKYIKAILNDRPYYGQCGIKLADIIPYQ